MGSLENFQKREEVFPFNLSPEKQNDLLFSRAVGGQTVSQLHMNTVQYRQCPSAKVKIAFRVRLLNELRNGWKNAETEARFLQAVNMIECDGAAIFSGLIDPSLFGQLVAAYDKLLAEEGNKAFMHSYVNLREHPGFTAGHQYTDAFSHPLLVSLISYLMGGAVRIMDLRGKDSDPISVNAQDNMLHVDNTPFKEEYKVLLNWRRHEVKGPSGQNFTFLPGTHRGNRDILVDEVTGQPWSTERDSLFVTDGAVDGLFAFQKHIGAHSRVVEVEHPDQPLAAVFPAGSLVHHRYRTEDGDPRSCIIAAFHLSSKHPGGLMELAPENGKPRTLLDFLVSYQDHNSTDEFISVLGSESAKIESKLDDIFMESHATTILDLDMLCLSGERLERWRRTVVSAPNVVATKSRQNISIPADALVDNTLLHDALANVMMYDKHGLLQLILYEDGREESRKPARKRIGEMAFQDVQRRLQPWIGVVTETPLSNADLTEPKSLRVLADAIAHLGENTLSTHGSRWPLASELRSLNRLMLDIGEAITRCEGPETYVCTSLFLFWTTEYIYEYLSDSDQRITKPILAMFLRHYVVAVLLVDLVLSHA